MIDDHHLIDCASVLRAIIAISKDGKYTVLADHFEGKKFNSPNDVIVGPDGALYFTDPTLDLPKGEKQEIPFKAYIASTKMEKLHCLQKIFRSPTAWHFLPTEKSFTLTTASSETFASTISRANATLTNGRIFGEEPGGKGEGVPDGIKVDRKGNLFVTGPKGIWVWSPEGTHLGTIAMPEQPANLTWGGKDLSTLYITATTSVYKLQTTTHGFLHY